MKKQFKVGTMVCFLIMVVLGFTVITIGFQKHECDTPNYCPICNFVKMQKPFLIILMITAAFLLVTPPVFTSYIFSGSINLKTNIYSPIALKVCINN